MPTTTLKNLKGLPLYARADIEGIVSGKSIGREHGGGPAFDHDKMKFVYTIKDESGETIRVEERSITQILGLVKYLKRKISDVVLFKDAYSLEPGLFGVDSF